MNQDYFLGLDMGTGSLGWAVTNDKYEVLRNHGKSLWGVRLFENANTAEERRSFRTARRRLDRRNWRLGVLQELFAEEISKIDQGFYLRMKESKYYPEDKRDLEGKCPEFPYALFVDADFTDKDYKKIDENTYLVSGSTSLYEIKKIMGVEIPDGDYETLSGFLLEKIGRIPNENEDIVIEDGKLTFKIEDYEDKRIKYVKICKNM